MTHGPLPITGERTVPDVWHENYWYRRHEAAYRFLLPFASARSVLDVGAGEGYGAALVATVAARVVAIDYDAAAVRHAAARYSGPMFVQANVVALPVGDATFDVVAALQVIEHIWTPERLLAECRRVLRPGGTLVVTTPNRLTFSPGGTAPGNPFHSHELTAAELSELLDVWGFAHVDVLGVCAGARLPQHGAFVAAQLAAPPVEWSTELAQRVAAVTVSDFVITGADADTALDLVAVARV
jgi:ubiquinone/menaquinone biosynthesis C-methylase UbiE